MQIVAEDLVIERAGRAVIDGLSFSVPGGTALVLVGANGAGKTTLLRTLAGFLTPTRGAIRLVGGDPEKTMAEQVHAVGHANAIKSHLTVAENVRFWASYLGGSGQAAERAMTKFALNALAEFPAGYLSAGQKRRLGLARLLAADRPIWLLDEPTASLDDASAALLIEAANAHISAGGLVVAATHIPLGFATSHELRLDALRAAA